MAENKNQFKISFSSGESGDIRTFDYDSIFTPQKVTRDLSGGSGGSAYYGSDSDRQQMIVNEANKHAFVGSGYCLKWVCNVYDTAFGKKCKRYGNVIAAYNAWTTTKINSNGSNVPLGAVVLSHNTAKASANGHIGIFIGNGIVRHNSSRNGGGVYNDKITDFMSTYGADAWAWIDNDNLSLVSASFSGAKHSATESEIRALTNACIQENGGSERAIKGEASLMCNLYESRGKSYSSVYNYVLKGRWFGAATRRAMNTNKHHPSTQQMNWVADVICRGNRTLDRKINEHDCYSDISWIKNDGKKYTSSSYIRNPSNYRKDKTIVNNRYGSKWTFSCFLRDNNAGDPYGYTG
jgi:hypothetical protein